MKKNFPLKTPVKIVRTGGDILENATGIIAGKSFESPTDFYIIILDKPLETALAISIIESCIEAI